MARKSRYVARENLNTFVQGLQRKMPVFAPVHEDAGLVFRPITDPEDVVWEFENTLQSVKSLFFPQTECMMRFHNSFRAPEGMVMQPEPLPDEPRLVLNVRPCDARAMVVLDAVFLQDEKQPDIFWQARRQNTVLVGLACNEPCSGGFCTSMQSGPHGEEGLDLLLVDVGEGYVVKALTDTGEDLVQDLPEAEHGDMVRAGMRRKKAEDEMGAILPTDNIIRRDVLTLYNRSFWEPASFSCLNCGACTFFCPTCHCFDIQDEVDGLRGRRIRIWDTCMSPLFTLHTSGHNPHAEPVDRFRQRFMHKFKYIPMRRDGIFGCVGCGRCVRLCPVNIDVREIVAMMNASEQAHD